MTTWNNTAPAVGNQISADIPDITENFAHIKSGLDRIFEDTWSDTDLTAFKIDTTVGFNDGTYNYEFPTNGVAAHTVIMLGNSSTIVWMYLNAAPPGWKVLTTGADSVLGVSGGTGDYNVNGGNADASATWDFAHNHQWYDGSAFGTDGLEENSSGQSKTWQTDGATQIEIDTDNDMFTVNSSLDTLRPKASVGKLFQLDTA
jgi:hypothetical protein